MTVERTKKTEIAGWNEHRDFHICAILKETEKALNVVGYRFPKFVEAFWIPKKAVEEAQYESTVIRDCTFKEAINHGWDEIRFWS